MFILFFFFKQKTAYEMRISDWSSDVCSSDLGYCALSGVVQHPGLYRCAVSYSGLTNLFTYLKDIPPYLEPFQQMIYNAVGHPEKDADYLRAVSPIFHTAEIDVPLMIDQGEKDTRVNVGETTHFVQKLRENGEIGR